MSRPNKITLNPNKLLVFLACISLMFVLLHVLFWSLYLFAGIDRAIFLRELFDLDLEVSIPTWYAQVQLLIGAMIGVVVAFHHRAAGRLGQARQWSLVAAIVLLLSLDEGGGIHEQLINIIKSGSESAGVLVNPWIIYAAVVVLLAGLILLNFFIALPKRTKILLVASASVFLCGAFVLDMVGGGYVSNTNYHKLLFIPLEEGLELLGAALAVYAFADYAKRHSIDLITEFK